MLLLLYLHNYSDVPKILDDFTLDAKENLGKVKSRKILTNRAKAYKT